ncbi:hypothetical protein AOL_s00140g76 [Orbilia oligospora ATCC 24927]|uniref:Uncharacterized protein n=1 Tax=Arthrobotrys oligospora (strain ATCC 24927 / CBS 115.81 / DSM 1491) TaxID=756982 RepID=G1XMA7_ARTOA|nr:hypothetical protein AOL_s00140g76 [Orbilia oligospora ATCC 24927]EGX45760.1 hypothetical protein AOL_s00140g76 [Orbilia oligospora ATCC 24927]
MNMNDSLECALCEERPGVVYCSCKEQFCEGCFSQKHLKRRPDHRRGGTSKTENFWTRVVGRFSGKTGIADIEYQASEFREDQRAKWFGLRILDQGNHRVSTIVETPRYRDLMDYSLHHNKNSPKTQFPSITSFVGLTGAGKSLLIRTLLYHAREPQESDLFEAPIPGQTSGSSAMISTTGEVNLYPEPSSFGTETPIFFADCEGLMGTEPVAAKHQNDWVTAAGTRKYEIRITMDRRDAVKALYPRLLYIFSDVICYVTSDHKSWADLAVRLMEWSKVGAQNTINQCSLPALIIILNAPKIENENWISGNYNAATADFFQAVDEEIRENNMLRELARQHGVKTMSDLFARSFSSVYLHYVPLMGLGRLGTSAEIYN